MQIYYKATIWTVIEVDNKEAFDKALDVLKGGGAIHDVYADDDIYPALVDNYVLQDTEEEMTVLKNDGYSTIEVMENNKKIWGNGR